MEITNVISENDFRKRAKEGKLGGGFLFYGSEDYMKSFAVKLAREAICPDDALAPFNNIRFEGLDLTPDGLLAALTTFPMMSETKLIEITHLDIKELKSSEIDELCSIFAMLPEYDYNTLIVTVAANQLELTGSSKKVPPIFKKLSEHLQPVVFDAPTPVMLSRWAEKHFLANGVRADSAVCASLIEYSGSDMYRLASEIDKLSYYALAQGRSEVYPEDIRTAAIADTSYEAFALANAISSNKKSDALRVLSEMKRRRIEPTVVLGEITGSFCDMLTVKLLTLEGLLPADISARTRIHEYRVKICLRAQMDVERLRASLKLCAEADSALKLSSMPGYTVLEKLVCSL